MAETLDTLPTPALVLDRAVLRRNLARMSQKVLGAGIDLRPHLKTCKSATIGRQATAPHSGAITVSTLAEARYFAKAGFRDILYGVGIVPSKLPEVAALRRQGVDLHVVTDNTVVAAEIVRQAEASGDTFSVFIEIDSGGGRAGLQPGSAAIVEVGRTLQRSNRVSIAGVMTHAGHSYHARTVAEVIGGALDEAFLPAAPDAGACRWCDYLEVCGPYEELRTDAEHKPADRLAPLAKLRGLR